MGANEEQLDYQYGKLCDRIVQLRDGLRTGKVKTIKKVISELNKAIKGDWEED